MDNSFISKHHTQMSLVYISFIVKIKFQIGKSSESNFLKVVNLTVIEEFTSYKNPQKIANLQGWQ